MQEVRFKKPIEGKVYESEYDIQSDIIQDPITRDTAPFVVTTIDLSVAGSRIMYVPGRAFVGYFYQTSTVNKTRQLNGLISVFVNNDLSSIPFPAKHNRGFRGSFTQLNLTWNAQANTSVDFLVLRSKYVPWMSDDINSALTTVGAAVDEAPTGAINGINTVFTLSTTPSPNTLKVFQDGLHLQNGIDYVLFGTTITLTVAPLPGQNIWANYQTGGTATWGDESPIGAINGVNTIFTMSSAPFDPNTLLVFRNGLHLRLGTDYNTVGAVITLAVAPAFGSNIWVNYRKT